MFEAVIYYHERKILSCTDVSEKAGKVPKTTNALNVRRLPAPLKTLNSFLRRYVRACFKQRRGENESHIDLTPLISPPETSEYFLNWHVTCRVVNFNLQMKLKVHRQVELKDIAKNGFQNYFDELYKLWQKCAVAQGSYFEGG
ncbi:hypothetical protein TNCV_2869341 [Trichonephila clavipes]|nr:hypothetical protein TNCV_2869341 [Trichonephila clavipes]